VLDVKEDAEAIRDFITSMNIAVLYFDQLLDNLGMTDNWRDKQVRDSLSPLRRIAQETGCAMIATMHPNKRGGSFRDRISGTPAFNAMSRSSLLVAAKPNEPGWRVAVRAKGNYSVEPPGFEFRVEQVYIEAGGRGRAKRTITTSRVIDAGDCDTTAAHVLDAGNKSRKRDDSKAGLARALLTGMFADGEKRRVADVQEELWKLHGLDARLVTRAASEVGLRKWQEGFHSGWWWQKPGRRRSDTRA
jgi:hypothetical protein